MVGVGNRRRACLTRRRLCADRRLQFLVELAQRGFGVAQLRRRRLTFGVERLEGRRDIGLQRPDFAGPRCQLQRLLGNSCGAQAWDSGQ